MTPTKVVRTLQSENLHYGSGDLNSEHQITFENVTVKVDLQLVAVDIKNIMGEFNKEKLKIIYIKFVDKIGEILCYVCVSTMGQY